MSCKRFTLAERGKLEFMLDKEKIALDHWMTQLVWEGERPREPRSFSPGMRSHEGPWERAESVFIRG